MTTDGYAFDEVYVGGGTPTVLPERLLETLAAVRRRHNVAGISVETNPNDLDRQRMRRLADAGVSRLSVGVQSFDDDLLREMRRYEPYGSSDEIRRHLERIDGVFETVNVDMIFNLPHQNDDSLSRDLDVLINELNVDQVSFYPLMSAGDSRAALEYAMGRVDRRRERRLYAQIAGRLLAAGYARTSAWCFSRKPGMFDEYIVDRSEYVGLGSGAFSYIDGTLYSSTFSNDQYMKQVRAGGTGTVLAKAMSHKEQLRYYLLMTLFGGSMNLSAAEARFGGRFQRSLWQELAGLRVLGAVRQGTDELRLTERGYYLWVVLMREFFSSVNHLRHIMRHGWSPVMAAGHAGE